MDQTFAKRIANQLNYNNGSYSFYGYSGMGYIGPAGEGFAGGFLEFKVSTGLWVVTGGQPTQRVALVEQLPESEEKERAAGAKNNLQSYIEAVPVPNPELTIKGLVSEGTDHNCCIYQPSSGKLWEFWRFAERTSGEWRSPSPGYAANSAAWNGNWFASGNPEHASKWGSSASGLSLTAGLITWRDIEEVLRGQKTNFGHALKLILAVTENAHRLPARNNDSATHTPELNAKSEPNPAFGTVDQAPEGSHVILPPSSSPTEWGISQLKEPLAWAFYETLRIYGAIVTDGGGNAAFRIEWPGLLGSVYSSCSVNPLVGYEGIAQKPEIEAYTSLIAGKYTDTTLPRITESFSGTHGIGWKLRNAYSEFELLEEYAE